MPIDVKESSNPNEIKLEVAGIMDESAELPIRAAARILRLDLKGLRGMNSMGVRNFISWGDQHRSVGSIRIEGCPSLLVKYFHQIRGFMKDNMVVMSFFVPFYSEKTNENSEYLFIRERDFRQDGTFSIPTLKDSKGNEMVIDVDPKSFFAFLKP